MKAISFDFSYKFTDGKFITDKLQVYQKFEKKKKIYTARSQLQLVEPLCMKKLSVIKRYLKTIER